MTHQVLIAGQMTDDDELSIDMGTLPTGEAWWEVPLPPCPDCGGQVVWWEAGYVPGTRKCLGCGSLFSVQCDERHVSLRRERLYR